MIFVTGGARSGKSVLAERLARERAAANGGRVTFIATARGDDEEMRARIGEHRRRRPRDWQTVEAAADLPGAVAAALAGGGTVLVDCLTVYISNLLMTQGLSPDERVGRLVESEMEKLAEICGNGGANGSGRLIFVSNEVGMGIVPGNALARSFRDIAGRANQRMAAAADEVYLCVSGIPLKVK